VPIPPGDELFGFTVRWPGRGYVVGPGSSIGGKPYISNGRDIAELPAAWVRAAAPPARTRPGTIVIREGFHLPQTIGSGQRYATVRDFSASQWAQGTRPDVIWELVKKDVAPRFATPKSEAELRADWERSMARIEDRLGPQRKGLDERDAVLALQPIVARPLAEYAVEAVVWLWHRFLPVGSITLFDGNPGDGKSTVVADLIARLTAGTEWPDGTPVGGAGDVLYITKEDDPRTQVRPRIEVAGGDVRRVRFVEADLLFPRDIARFRELLAATRPRLVLMDPLMSYLEGKIRTISDNDVRSAIMTPLAEASREVGCATLVIRHFNKGTGQSALNRGAGSLGGLAGSARMVLSLTTHPGDPDARVFGVIKSNYEARPKALKVVIEPAPVVGFHMTVSRATWVGESDVSITDAMERDSEQHERVVAAVEDLREILDPRKAVSGLESRTVKAQMKARGHTERAITAARRTLGVVIQRTAEVPSKTVWLVPSVVLSDERSSRDGRDGRDWQEERDSRDGRDGGDEGVTTELTADPPADLHVLREISVSTGRYSGDGSRIARTHARVHAREGRCRSCDRTVALDTVGSLKPHYADPQDAKWGEDPCPGSAKRPAEEGTPR
jgi:DNA repair protein RadA/Sms